MHALLKFFWANSRRALVVTAGLADRPSDYSRANGGEDFAESVEATIYGVSKRKNPGKGQYIGSTRDTYINELFRTW